MGFENLVELYDAVCVSTGREAFVVDGDHLVAVPGRTVEAYCRHLGLPFRGAALLWQAGALEDWSHSAAGTRRLRRPLASCRPTPSPSPPSSVGAEAFVAYHWPFYDRLLARVRTPGAG